MSRALRHLAPLLVVSSVWAVTCAHLPRFPLRGAGVTLWRVGEEGLPPGGAVQGMAGDWVLESDRVRLVVAGLSDKPGRRRLAGAVIDAVAGTFPADELRAWQVLVLQEGHELPLQARAILPVTRHQRPAVRVEHLVKKERLLVLTEVQVRPGRPYTEVRTRVTNQGATPARGLRIADRVAWPGSFCFAPGLGWVEAETRGPVRWFAREGRALSYALAFPAGEVGVHFRFEPHGPYDQLATSQPFDLAPGEARTVVRRLVVVRGGLAHLAAAAWPAAGIPVRPVSGTVQPPPSRGRVNALDIQGRMILSAGLSPDGRFSLALPRGRYRLVAHGPGGQDTEEVDLRTRADLSGLVLTPPLPGKLRYRITDAAGQTMPARLVVRGIEPHRDPHFGADHMAHGARNILHSHGGEGEAELPAGRFQVTVTRGPEYSIVSREVVVRAEQGVALRVSLEREVDTSGWIAADLHLHAEPSPDSSVSLVDRVASLAAEGIEFAAATDHNHITDYAGAIEALGARSRIAAVPGVEITTWDPQWGHFNAFPVPANLPVPPFAGQTPASIFDWVRGQAPEALLQVNHPRMEPGIGYFNLVQLDTATALGGEHWRPTFDAIEVFNGMDLGRPEILEANLRDWYNLLNRGHRFTATGSSDSHRLVYQWVGYPRTYIRVAHDDPARLRAGEVAAALRAGQALVTTGPFIDARVGDVGPGQTVTAKDGTVRLHITVRAARWIDVRELQIVVDGETVRSDPIPATTRRVERARRTFELDLARDAWIVVAISGVTLMEEVLPWSRARPVAFTNPIWVDVDGDGRYTPPATSRDAAPDAPDGSLPDGSLPDGSLPDGPQPDGPQPDGPRPAADSKGEPP